MSTLRREYTLPNGGKVKVTVESDNPDEYFIASEAGAVGIAECLINLADTLKPQAICREAERTEK